MENGPGLKMYFLLNMGIFQPAMLVYQSVPFPKTHHFGALHAVRLRKNVNSWGETPLAVALSGMFLVKRYVKWVNIWPCLGGGFKYLPGEMIQFD